MARTVALSLDTVAFVRLITGTPVAADSATLTDANFSPTTSATTGGAIYARGYATIWVGAEFTAAGAASVDLDMLIRDSSAADGARWKRLLLGAPSGITAIAAPVAYQPTIDGSGFKEVRVDGRLVFPRIVNVVGAPTVVRLLAFPGVPMAGVRLFQ